MDLDNLPQPLDIAKLLGDKAQEETERILGLVAEERPKLGVVVVGMNVATDIHRAMAIASSLLKADLPIIVVQSEEMKEKILGIGEEELLDKIAIANRPTVFQAPPVFEIKDVYRDLEIPKFIEDIEEQPFSKFRGGNNFKGGRNRKLRRQ